MIIEILLLFIIAILMFDNIVIRLKFKPVINMAEQIKNFLDQVDTPSPLDRKRDILKQNLSLVNSSEKKQWTPELLDKATEKQLNNLLKKVSKPESKDLLSKMSGIDDFSAMMKDVNSNFLIQNSTSELIGKVTGKLPSFAGNSPMEVLGSHVFEKCGIYLAPVSLFCTIFNHLDWGKFAEIAEQRRVQMALQEKVELFDKINGEQEANDRKEPGRESSSQNHQRKTSRSSCSRQTFD